MRGLEQECVVTVAMLRNIVAPIIIDLLKQLVENIHTALPLGITKCDR